MEITKFGVHFGALADPISKQLKDQKLEFNAEKVKDFEKQLDALFLLSFGGIIPSSQIGKCHERLFRKIGSHVMSANKLKKITPTKK